MKTDNPLARVPLVRFVSGVLTGQLPDKIHHISYLKRTLVRLSAGLSGGENGDGRTRPSLRGVRLSVSRVIDTDDGENSSRRPLISEHPTPTTTDPENPGDSGDARALGYQSPAVYGFSVTRVG